MTAYDGAKGGGDLLRGVVKKLSLPLQDSWATEAVGEKREESFSYRGETQHSFRDEKQVTNDVTAVESRNESISNTIYHETSDESSEHVGISSDRRPLDIDEKHLQWTNQVDESVQVEQEETRDSENIIYEKSGQKHDKTNLVKVLSINIFLEWMLMILINFTITYDGAFPGTVKSICVLSSILIAENLKNVTTHIQAYRPWVHRMSILKWFSTERVKFKSSCAY